MNQVYLNGDGMVNLNKEDFEFVGLNCGEWCVSMDDEQLDEFLRLNNCELNGMGKIEDQSEDFKGTIWGTVLEIVGGAK